MKPGSPEAAAAGCRCPVMDNARGRGYMGGMKDEDGNTMFAVRTDCPLHGSAAPIPEKEDQMVVPKPKPEAKT